MAPADAQPQRLLELLREAGPNGASYTQGHVVDASYACAPGANGGALQSCEGPVATGQAIDTATAGHPTLTLTATDTDGQTAAATSTYTVHTATGMPPPPTGPPGRPTTRPRRAPARARLTGVPAACVRTRFTARVKGTGIAAIRWFLDGRRIPSRRRRGGLR